ncbi:hypothetical protein [Rhizobium leguminosarum]|uniref:hypothetical protein n=1 Tax=Rhizobium leguminosarum TaxID=384 RepID=UPI0015DB5A94|nr:hypothetical protein [Rhizobium leguminosarum]NZD51792.1 hypothetical protein [Rhizobium leguminosarum]
MNSASGLSGPAFLNPENDIPGIAAAIHHSNASIYPNVFAKALLNPRFNEKAVTAAFAARPRVRWQPSNSVIKL